MWQKQIEQYEQLIELVKQDKWKEAKELEREIFNALKDLYWQGILERVITIQDSDYLYDGNKRYKDIAIRRIEQNMKRLKYHDFYGEYDSYGYEY